MKKRFLAALLALAVTAACLTGCGGENKTEDKKEGTTTQATTTTEGTTTTGETTTTEGTTTTGETTTTTAETTTAEKTTTTASETTTTTAKAPKQKYYEYDVAGAKIKLRTHIEDYISQDDRGDWEINLKGIAKSLGFHNDTHVELYKQVSFTNDREKNIYFDEEKYMGYYRIVRNDGNGCKVSFARYDIGDDSITSYWITNGADNAYYKINFQQIVIFTALLENVRYAPSEDWMEQAGFPTTSAGPSYYFVSA